MDEQRLARLEYEMARDKFLYYQKLESCLHQINDKLQQYNLDKNLRRTYLRNYGELPSQILKNKLINPQDQKLVNQGKYEIQTELRKAYNDFILKRDVYKQMVRPLQREELEPALEEPVKGCHCCENNCTICFKKIRPSEAQPLIKSIDIVEPFSVAQSDYTWLILGVIFILILFYASVV